MPFSHRIHGATAVLVRHKPQAYSQIDYGKIVSAIFQLSNLVGYAYGLGLGFWL